MKKRYGFTLIELLAVIIVLAIIALIAMPIIFNVIENAKLKSLENSAYGVVDAVRLYYMENLMNTDNGEVPLNGSVTTLTLSGEHPTGGTWTIENSKDVTNNRGIKIEGVTFASMQDYVCDSEEDASGNLTGKVICLKDSITFTVEENAINENGWANDDFNVSVSVEGVSNIKYCIDDEKCTPTEQVSSNSKEVTISTEGETYFCVGAEGVKTRCNIYSLDKTTPTLTVKNVTPTVFLGKSNEISKYLTSTYGPSNGNIVCKDSNNNEINNTSGLAIGTHTVTCSAIGNNGKSSTNVSITINVEKQIITLSVDADNDGVAEIGDEVCIEEECFYVLSNDGTNIRMLAKYRIDVSNNTTRKNRLQSTTGTLTTIFSSTNNAYSGSIAEGLINDYKNTLIGLGATGIDVNLLQYDEIKDGTPFNCGSACDPNYSWLYKDGNVTPADQWIGISTAAGANRICPVIYNAQYKIEDCALITPLYNSSYGIRPVVTIPSSSL